MVTARSIELSNFSRLKLQFRVMGKRKIVLSDSEYASSSVEDLGHESYAPTRKAKTPSGRQPIKKKTKHVSDPSTTAMGSSKGGPKPRNVALPHPKSTHRIESPGPIRVALLHWYSGVQASRGMPWRKPYNPSLEPEQRAQRAYEVRPLYCASREQSNFIHYVRCGYPR
jgi:A/G-specific adenine glycosylase